MKESIKRRLAALEKLQEQWYRTPVVIVTLNAGGYAYKGRVYSEKEFAALMGKAKPETIIVNDIPRE